MRKFSSLVLYFFSLLFTFLIMLPRSFANVNSSTLWNCTLEASLKGDGSFFQRFGRDSWKGRATLLCTAGAETQRKEVDITFVGALGFGVNESSVISMSAEVITSNLPSNFEAYAYVFNKDAPAIVWRNESGTILIEANVISTDIPGIQASLQEGKLFIR